MSTMQMWEYCELELAFGGPITGNKGTSWVLKSDGKHIQTEGDYGKMVARLGLEGWEVAAASARIATGVTGKHKINYLFKRPVLEEAR